MGIAEKSFYRNIGTALLAQHKKLLVPDPTRKERACTPDKLIGRAKLNCLFLDAKYTRLKNCRLLAQKAR